MPFLFSLALLLTFLGPLTACADPARRTPDEVLLVSNSNSPISSRIAKDYAKKRKIENVLAIQCVDSANKTDNETIPMADYLNSIETPILNDLAKHQNIQFIVLTKGIPIRISGSDTGQRSVNDPANTPLTASVDGHLAAMDYKQIPDAVKISITGSGATGYAWLNRYWNAAEPFSHAKFGGYLVTRLDGYTEADAKGLITRALTAERRLAHGKILLDVQPIFGLGDKSTQPAPIAAKPILEESDYSDFNADMIHADDILVARGIRSELNLTEAFVGHRSDLLGYFSFGSNDGKFSEKAYKSLFFAPGAISDTAVSTSARTFLPTEGGQSLLVDLIAQGLTGGKGYSDEPLLQAISSPTIDLDRYTLGYTLAESFYAGSHFVGWQDIVVGDPLCCPYFKIAPAR